MGVRIELIGNLYRSCELTENALKPTGWSMKGSQLKPTRWSTKGSHLLLNRTISRSYDYMNLYPSSNLTSQHGNSTKSGPIQTLWPKSLILIWLNQIKSCYEFIYGTLLGSIWHEPMAIRPNNFSITLSYQYHQNPGVASRTIVNKKLVEATAMRIHTQ